LPHQFNLMAIRISGGGEEAEMIWQMVPGSPGPEIKGGKATEMGIFSRGGILKAHIGGENKVPPIFYAQLSPRLRSLLNGSFQNKNYGKKSAKNKDKTCYFLLNQFLS
jgi:hypothetical protein